MAVDNAYPDPALNQLYNLLFADDVGAFPMVEASATTEALTSVAEDDKVESRVRVVALRRLAERGVPPSVKPPLLGAIVEIGLHEGLDTLAAYADGGARYINHAGGVSIVEPGGPLTAQVEAVLLTAKRVVAAIGPWQGERLPPPSTDEARLTFLVGGQLYFGQGPFGALANDALAGPVLATATALLRTIAMLPKDERSESDA
jgi:hypothetical protein